MDVSKYVGSRIKYFRQLKNVTQGEIAEVLKTTTQTISRYEKGQRRIDYDTLYDLAIYFNVSINDFFPETTNQKQVDEYKKILKDKGLMDENEKINIENFNRLIKIADMIQEMDKKKED